MSYSLTLADQFNLDNSMFVLDKQEDGTYQGTTEFFDVCMMLDLDPIDNVLDIGLFSNIEIAKSPIDLFIDEYILNNGHPDLGLSNAEMDDIDAESMQDLLYDWYIDTYCNEGDTDGDCGSKLRSVGVKSTNRICPSITYGASSICEGDTDGDPTPFHLM